MVVSLFTYDLLISESEGRGNQHFHHPQAHWRLYGLARLTAVTILQRSHYSKTTVVGWRDWWCTTSIGTLSINLETLKRVSTSLVSEHARCTVYGCSCASLLMPSSQLAKHWNVPSNLSVFNMCTTPEFSICVGNRSFSPVLHECVSSILPNSHQLGNPSHLWLNAASLHINVGTPNLHLST